MIQTKICPDCGVEYFSHIEKCADCGTVLLLPEEREKLKQEKKECRNRALKDSIVIREGELKWIDDLYNVLLDASVPCAIHADTGCKKGCRHPCRLLVSALDAERANELIEEHFMKVHPEFRTSKELILAGNCPACASPVMPDAIECPDCGLTLLIIE